MKHGSPFFFAFRPGFPPELGIQEGSLREGCFPCLRENPENGQRPLVPLVAPSGENVKTPGQKPAKASKSDC
jgi:hypothetical protein